MLRGLDGLEDAISLLTLAMEMEEQGEAFRVLEFYSGIGGMRFSLKQAGIQATVVEAFDINNIANDVYEHNFRHCPYQGNIQSLTAAQLDKLRADAWLLSPPCQPYTRQGLQKDAEDARASSFLRILELIPLTSYPPTKLFVENVVGFESSNTHKQLMLVLEKTGFATQEFILSPLQFGIPYSRPRYFCLAKKAPLSFTRPEFNGQLLSNITPLISGEDDKLQKDRVPFNGTVKHTMNNMHEVVMDPQISCRAIKDFLEPGILRSDIIDSTEMGSSRSNECLFTKKVKDDSEDLHSKRDCCILNGKQHLVHNRDFHMAVEYDCEGGIGENNCFTSIHNDHFRTSRWEQYRVPVSLIERWGDAMDIVFPESRHCCCFTKSYGRYVKGTGSFLATAKDVPNNGILNENELKVEMKNNASLLQKLGLRYFTPREVANLHSFPEEFSFPIHVSLRQRYALLGNSLSIAVVAPLFKYLFTD